MEVANEKGGLACEEKIELPQEENILSFSWLVSFLFPSVRCTVVLLTKAHIYTCKIYRSRHIFKGSFRRN
jgi:hypothetical protein